MKALRFAQYGTPSVLSIQEIPLPSLADGDVLVQVQASGINPSDLGAVAGRFHSQLPMTPGRDFSGVVVEGGSGRESMYGELAQVLGLCGRALMPSSSLYLLPGFRRNQKH
jgi:NADPH:quinone reductase-like Zn-dependent oxidoreductase